MVEGEVVEFKALIMLLTYFDALKCFVCGSKEGHFSQDPSIPHADNHVHSSTLPVGTEFKFLEKS